MASVTDLIVLFIWFWTSDASVRTWIQDLWRYLAPLIRSWLSRFEFRLLYRGRPVLALGTGGA